MPNSSCKGEVFFGTNKGGDVIDTNGKRCLSMNAVGDTCPYTVKELHTTIVVNMVRCFCKREYRNPLFQQNLSISETTVPFFSVGDSVLIVALAAYESTINELIMDMASESELLSRSLSLIRVQEMIHRRDDLPHRARSAKTSFALIRWSKPQNPYSCTLKAQGFIGGRTGIRDYDPHIIHRRSECFNFPHREIFPTIIQHNSLGVIEKIPESDQDVRHPLS